MDLFCRVLEIKPLKQRTYTDRNGQTQVINERQLLIGAGVCHFYGTMVGNTATNFNEADPEWLTVTCVCNIDIISRDYTKDGATNFFTDVRINRIDKL